MIPTHVFTVNIARPGTGKEDTRAPGEGAIGVSLVTFTRGACREQRKTLDRRGTVNRACPSRAWDVRVGV